MSCVKYWKVIVGLIVAACVTQAALADIETTPTGVPHNLHIYSEVGNTYVDLMADKCSSSRYVLYPDHAKFDAIFSILLAAQLGNQKVQLRYDGCVNAGQQGRIIGVYLLDD